MKILDEMMNSFNFEQFTFSQMLVSLMFSIIFGVMGMIVYRYYHRKNEAYDLSISRGFPLIAPSVTAIFWLIQTSLPLSLGLIGAMSFVRFRSPVKRAEDIGFILIIISMGLACAVKQFQVALVLISFVALLGFVRRKIATKFFMKNNGNIAIHSQEDGFLSKLTSSSDQELKKLVLVSMTSRDSLTSVFFSGPALDLSSLESIKKSVLGIDPKARVEFFFPDNQVG